LPAFEKGVATVLGEQIQIQTKHEELSGLQWYALYTRSHCEQLVCDQLAAKGFDLFLPKIEVWSQRAGKRHLINIPMFSGYLFLHHIMDKTSYIEVCKARGLVRILGERWDKLSTIPDAEIEAIQRLVTAQLPVLPYPFLQKGQAVRITQGPLVGVEGILVNTKPTKGLLVLTVELLQRSVAVEVDCNVVTAA
jgi:transcription termination/antitermination protein NusG